jgi:hypothetical protein
MWLIGIKWRKGFKNPLRPLKGELFKFIAVILNGYSFLIYKKTSKLKIRKVFFFSGTQFLRRGGGGGGFLYGTGSYPCPPQGWHLLMRFMVNHNPLNGPYFFNASIPYCEQVGV